MERAVRVAKDKTHGCNVRSSHPHGTGERKKERKKTKNKESPMAKMCGWMSAKMNIWAVITEWAREVTLDNA